MKNRSKNLTFNVIKDEDGYCIVGMVYTTDLKKGVNYKQKAATKLPEVACTNYGMFHKDDIIQMERIKRQLPVPIARLVYIDEFFLGFAKTSLEAIKTIIKVCNEREHDNALIVTYAYGDNIPLPRNPNVEGEELLSLQYYTEIKTAHLPQKPSNVTSYLAALANRRKPTYFNADLFTKVKYKVPPYIQGEYLFVDKLEGDSAVIFDIQGKEFEDFSMITAALSISRIEIKDINKLCPILKTAIVNAYNMNDDNIVYVDVNVLYGIHTQLEAHINKVFNKTVTDGHVLNVSNVNGESLLFTPEFPLKTTQFVNEQRKAFKYDHTKPVTIWGNNKLITVKRYGKELIEIVTPIEDDKYLNLLLREKYHTLTSASIKRIKGFEGTSIEYTVVSDTAAKFALSFHFENLTIQKVSLFNDLAMLTKTPKSTAKNVL